MLDRTVVLVSIVLAATCGGARPAPGPGEDGEAGRHRFEALLAQLAGDHARCAEHAERAAALDLRSEDDAYQAAICHVLAGRPDAAFRALDAAIARGLRDVELVRIDPELAPLHEDPRWPEALRRIQARLDAHLPKINVELYRLMIEDQKMRMVEFDTLDVQELIAKDAERLERVRRIVEAGGAKVADDFYNAAVVFQHGRRPEDYRIARTLALRAVELDPSLRGARWLAASATDRELTSQGKPQRFGTQSRSTSDGRIELHPVDPSVTDEERARWRVPPLSYQQRLAEARTALARRSQPLPATPPQQPATPPRQPTTPQQPPAP